MRLASLRHNRNAIAKYRAHAVFRVIYSFARIASTANVGECRIKKWSIVVSH